MTWPTLKLEEKRALYLKYASHELHFFLYKKDPEFFKTAIRPYLANKYEKQFFDHWFLEDDLSDYLKSWNFEQLNTLRADSAGERSDGEQSNTGPLSERSVRSPASRSGSLRSSVPDGAEGQFARHRGSAGNSTAQEEANRATILSQTADGVIVNGSTAMPPTQMPTSAPAAPAAARPAGAERLPPPAAGLEAGNRFSAATCPPRRSSAIWQRPTNRKPVTSPTIEPSSPKFSNTTASSTRPWNGSKATTITLPLDQQTAALDLGQFVLARLRRSSTRPWKSRFYSTEPRRADA